MSELRDSETGSIAKKKKKKDLHVRLLYYLQFKPNCQHRSCAATFTASQILQSHFPCMGILVFIVALLPLVLCHTWTWTVIVFTINYRSRPVVKEDLKTLFPNRLI